MMLTYSELIVLHKIRRMLDVDEPIDSLLGKVLDVLSKDLKLRHGIITVIDENLSGTKVEMVNAVSTETLKDVVYKFGEGITGSVAQSGVPAVIPDISKEASFLNKTGIRNELSGVSFICIPIKYKGKVIGTISVDYKKNESDSSLENVLNFLTEVGFLLSGVINNFKVMDENRRLKHLIFDDAVEKSFNRIIGNSDKMKAVQLLIYQVAPTPSTVLVMGETGTGKELVAAEIHNLSPRKDKSFIAVNCGAIPPNLIESELFGYEKGAFTGAYKTTVGKIEAASEGTLFLDEIGEMPIEAQAKLLRVLESRAVQRIGSHRSMPVNVRIVAATNKILEDEVRKSRFREELFYRLNVFPIYLPPLRERGSDVILLANYFIAKYNSMLSKNVLRIDTPAIDMIMAYHWPGNVRELQNTLERAMILTNDAVIRSENLPPSLQIKSFEDRTVPRGRLKELVASYEKGLIIDALKDTNGSQTKAAKLLGTTKRVIQYAIDNYKIDFKRFKKRRYKQQG